MKMTLTINLALMLLCGMILVFIGSFERLSRYSFLYGVIPFTLGASFTLVIIPILLALVVGRGLPRAQAASRRFYLTLWIAWGVMALLVIPSMD